MNIIFLLLISSYSYSCGSLKLEQIFAENQGLPTSPHLEVYLTTLLKKAPLRQKYCGEKFDSPSCLKKLSNLDIPSLVKIQTSVGHTDLLIHENSDQNDIDEFLIKEFSNSESRVMFKSDDRHRMPLIIKQTDYSDLFLNIVAVECQQELIQKNGEIRVNELLVKPTFDLVTFLQKKPIPVFEYSQAFESIAIFLETPARGAEFFGLCIENVEKSCELSPKSNLCELKRTANATAWKYSQFTHQINYFEAIREDGHSSFHSTKEMLMNKLVLRSPASVMELSKSFEVGICVR